MKKTILLFALLFSFTSLYAQTGNITSLQVSQRTGDEERMVDIEFELSGTGTFYEISLEVSFDSGESFTMIDPSEITGEIHVIPGTVLLVWDGRESYPEISSAEALIRLNATRGVKDIDGNFYRTVLFSSQTYGTREWMAENLRVTKYNDGVAIITGLNNSNWNSTNSGAYAVYELHPLKTDGISSEAEMVAAYGKLYNWHAVATDKLCPAGWSVPGDADWTELVNHLDAQGFPNFHLTDNELAGNSLKSCRQVDSPLGGDCNTSAHPRWNAHQTLHGFDAFNFSALPGGMRNHEGPYQSLGNIAYWWTSSENLPNPVYAYGRYINYNNGGVIQQITYKNHGFSIRCYRDFDN